MPSKKVAEAQLQDVVVDANGGLHTVVGVYKSEMSVYLWLMPDHTDSPTSFQVFGVDDEMNVINNTTPDSTPVDLPSVSGEETVVLPAVAPEATDDVEGDAANG